MGHSPDAGAGLMMCLRMKAAQRLQEATLFNSRVVTVRRPRPSSPSRCPRARRGS